MKKSVLALAVLGTFAGSAAAQTSLSIYGLADAGYVRENGGPNGDINKFTSGIQNGSRIGFRGQEDLGRGLQAKFVLEAGINIDDGTSGQSAPTVPPQPGAFNARTGTTRLFGRQAYVGLGGNWGNVTIGRQYTPHYLALAEVDPFGAGLAGNAANFVPTILRMDNTIKYTTPAWAGFTADVSYAFGEVPDENTDRRQYGISVGYANGPLLVKLAYHKANGDIPEGGFPVIPQPPGTVPPLLTAGIPLDEDAKMWMLGGKWDFGVAAAHLAYSSTKAERTLAADTRDWLVGVTVPFGAGKFLASYMHKTDEEDFGSDANQISLGYTHAISKRTNFYVSWARVDNDLDEVYTVGNATERGSGDKQFNVGVRHLF